jgi:hypothetical protein
VHVWNNGNILPKFFPVKFSKKVRIKGFKSSENSIQGVSELEAFLVTRGRDFILKNFSLNLLSKMFVLTEIIDCVFLLFIVNLLITDMAQDGVFLEIALCTLWTPQLHPDNVIDNIAHTLATYL